MSLIISSTLFTLKYLDALDKVDNSGRYHWKLVKLYAAYAPDKLLSFLKRSNSYPIQEALDICKRELFYPEMVYLLGRMGNTSEALSIIIHKLNDIQMAIDFCKENNDMDLWRSILFHFPELCALLGRHSADLQHTLHSLQRNAMDPKGDCNVGDQATHR